MGNLSDLQKKSVDMAIATNPLVVDIEVSSYAELNGARKATTTTHQNVEVLLSPVYWNRDRHSGESGMSGEQLYSGLAHDTFPVVPGSNVTVVATCAVLGKIALENITPLTMEGIVSGYVLSGRKVV